ncbi:uncharacterized protein LOC123546048 [Mercenaria mercenaria]|uniref:uncharacterized protein LOC123546048 n=1 Tax=Mercenaria mercenaria TaxID=6596 RepID=UPI00234EBE77|nr:uncharacterized protein LOC123546048 [Mercenaria mercenaria]
MLSQHKKLNSQEVSKAITPIKISPLSFWIKGYKLADHLLEGFKNGFRLGFVGDRCSYTTKNLKSCYELPEVVSAKLEKEIALKRIAGPFSIPPFQPFRVSPIGVVPKKEPNSYRLIHHLSYPLGNSVNDFIGPNLATVQYSTFDQAVTMVRNLGQGCLMAKTDIDSAYRIIPIHPIDYSLLGFKFNDSYFYDRSLPMGASSSCAIFDRFSSGLKWIAQCKLSIPHILHILDDFLIMGPKDSNKCETDLRVFLDLCRAIRVPIKHEKTVTATTVITFMGLELDSNKMEARLPKDKLVKLYNLLVSYKSRRKIKLRDLQSLLGLLNFCCKVVLPGRAFLRRLIDLTKGVCKPHHRITISKEGRRDLEAWYYFIEHFNGKHILLDQKWLTNQALHLFTDASGSIGYGAILNTQWFYGTWPVTLADSHITYKEFFPITLALELWGSQLANKCIVLHSDNNAVVHIINKQSCKDSQIMYLVRSMVLACMKHNILVRSEHVPGKQNTLADMLSRLQIEEFLRNAPYADRVATRIPEALLKHH